MVKIFICLMLMWSSLTAFAQIQTGGGGPDGDGIPKELGEKDYFQLLKKYEDVIQKIKQQSIECSKSKTLQITTLEELYLEIFWRTVTSTKTETTCGQQKIVEDPFVQCLLTPTTKRKLRSIVNHPKANIFLRFVESAEQSVPIIDFLSEISNN